MDAYENVVLCWLKKFVAYYPAESNVLLKICAFILWCEGAEYLWQYPLHGAGSDLIYALDLSGLWSP